MSSESSPQVSHDERILAAVSHAAALFPGFGFLVPLAVWITQREWSRFVKFHALQALFYQLTAPPLLLALFVFGNWGVFDTLRLGYNPGSMPGGLVFLRCLLVLVFFSAWAGYVYLGMRAASKALDGREYYYPMLGRRVTRYLRPEG
jgi:uncharacterized Tic20 family protein